MTHKDPNSAWTHKDFRARIFQQVSEGRMNTVKSERERVQFPARNNDRSDCRCGMNSMRCRDVNRVLRARMTEDERMVHRTAANKFDERSGRMM